jgi:hypothetical protein
VLTSRRLRKCKKNLGHAFGCACRRCSQLDPFQFQHSEILRKKPFDILTFLKSWTAIPTLAMATAWTYANSWPSAGSLAQDLHLLPCPGFLASKQQHGPAIEIV